MMGQRPLHPSPLRGGAHAEQPGPWAGCCSAQSARRRAARLLTALGALQQLLPLGMALLTSPPRPSPQQSTKEGTGRGTSRLKLDTRPALSHQASARAAHPQTRGQGKKC